MNTNLDKIALDLYGKIQTRFPDIKIGDENAAVLSKKSDIPNARFFEFEYKDQGKSLGTVAITLDEDDGVIVQVSGELADSNHHGAFKFLRSFRQFAKNRLLNFDIQNIGKSELDKRDYEFQAKPKEEPQMEPMMESKMYGTARMSYQDLGEATLIVKHSQPINLEVPAGRTMHIEGIWVENADGERFKYPYKHLNGARALAEHIKAGGNPYDSIGKHITSLSEELAQLRKFKGYVSRNEALSEAMGDITNKVFERIEEVKKEIHNLQRPSYYQQFAESFQDREEQLIPEEIMSDWIDRLTIRTFNEDLKTAFPYIFRLVDESEIPVKELEPEDLLNDAYNPNSAGATHARDLKAHHRAELRKKAEAGDERAKAILKRAEENDEARRVEFDARMERESVELDEVFDGDKEEGTTHKGGKVEKTKHGIKHTKTDYEDGHGQPGKKSDDIQSRYKKYSVPDPEEQFESFINELLEDEIDQEGENELFSKDVAKQSAALDKLKELLSGGLKPGADGVNAVLSLKGILDSSLFQNEYLQGLTDEDDVGTAVKLYLRDLSTGKITDSDAPGAKKIAQQIIATKALDADGATPPVGGETPPPPEAPLAPPPAPDATAAAPAPDATAVPPAPPAGVPPAPPMQESEEDPPFDPDPPRKNPPALAGKHGQGPSTAKHLAKAGMIKAIHSAKKAGAKLDTKLDLGHREMTLHDCIRECGMDPKDFGFEPEGGVDAMIKSISGFWNKEAKNFTIGGTRAKVKVIKDFKDGMFKGATEQDLRRVIQLIDKMDPSENVHTQELNHIKHLSGTGRTEVEVGEGAEQDDFAKMMAQFQQMHPQADIGKMMQQVQNDPNAKITRNNTSSGTIDGKPASYDNAMNKFKGMAGGMGFDAGGDDPIGGMMKGIQGKMGGMMNKMPQGQPGGKMPQGMPDMGGMMKGFGMNESDELSSILKIAGVKK
jgi:hypothetical protein